MRTRFVLLLALAVPACAETRPAESPDDRVAYDATPTRSTPAPTFHAHDARNDGRDPNRVASDQATDFDATMPAAPTPAPADASSPPAGFAPAPGTEADAANTARNARDREGSTLTPLDQGNSRSEVQITADIRKGILDTSMSTSAKNVKIITVGGKVTLRGPVASEAERTRIESLARGTAGVTAVDNQLEVSR